MKRSMALPRLAGALLLLGVVAFGLGPSQAIAACKSCVVGGLCRDCPTRGMQQPCRMQVCCGVTTVLFCADCRPTCVPPP